MIRRTTAAPAGVTIPLADLTRGATATVVDLDLSSTHCGKLLAMGVLPGVTVRLLQRFPSFVFQVGRSQFTVDRELAEQVYLRVDP
ncbi:MAG: ferrous iron transport protein A [Planctomycetes bacterium]|nr:ferrous iron transport protein A [Planctomycetota bacterium]